MKILAFSDTHSDLEAVKKLATLAKSGGVDVILCAGDISEFGDKIGQLFKELDIGVPMVYIPGNHEEEGSDVSKRFKYIKNIHKKTLCIDGILFLGCGGGGLSRYYTAFERLIPTFKSAVEKHKGASILVTHAPPYKTKLDLMGRMDAGVESIRKFIDAAQPDFAISGHLHENAGREDKVGKTVCINPGSKGVIIEV